MAKQAFSFSDTPALNSCDHLAWLSSALVDIPSADAPCNRCQDTSDNYLCLYCKEVLCSRYVNMHMLAHYEKSNHCLVLGYRDLVVWCYSCHAFLDAQAISALRPVYETALALKYLHTPPLRATERNNCSEPSLKVSLTKVQGKPVQFYCNGNTGTQTNDRVYDSSGKPGASQTNSRNKKSPQTPPKPTVDDTLLHLNTQISSLETRIEKLVVSDTKLHPMKKGMDQYKSEVSAEIDGLRSDLRRSEHSLRALIEDQHEEMRALVIRQHKEVRAELSQSEDRARALAERQHKEIMAYLHSKFSPPPQP